MSSLVRSVDLVVHGTAARVSGRSRHVLVSSGHRVHAVDMSDGTSVVVGSGYDLPTAIAVSEDGATLYVADLDSASDQFTLYAVTATKALGPRPGRVARGRALLRAPGHPRQMAVRDDTLYYCDKESGSLSSVDLATGAVTVVGTGLVDPMGVVVVGDRILVSERSAGRLSAITPGDADFTVLRAGLAHPQFLTADGRNVLVAEYGGTDPLRVRTAGFVQSISPRTARPSTVLTTGRSRPLAAHRVGRRTVVTVDGRGIRWWDLLATPTPEVTMKVADAEPFIGTYQRVTVDLNGTGRAFGDLDFVLPDGDAAGRVSYSRDDASAPDEVMLLVGYQPGHHQLQAVDRASGAVVSTLDFTITDTWTDHDASPASWNVGTLSSFVTGYTWGGGSTTPQNVDVIPQSGTRTLCLLMVDVSDSRYPAGAVQDAIRADWVDGAVGPAPSARAYYEEVSHGGFTLGLAGGAPLVSLAASWSDTFTTMPDPWPTNSFAPVNGKAFAQACISSAAALTDGAGHPLVDFSTVQSLILVVRSKGAAAGDDFFWPQAWGSSFTIPGGTRNMSVLGMPDDWSTVRDTRAIHETLAHEMGHNLGYPDLYTNVDDWHYSADVRSRDVTDLDLMSSEARLPHMSIAQKLETGWVRPEWIRNFDFSRSTTPRSETVTLHAVETGAPPVGSFSGIEIRVADGWNYYFEYRRTQAGQIGDQELAAGAPETGDGVVVGTDVYSQSFSYPIPRPQIIRLRPDAEGERSFFSAGQDYKERDHTSPMALADFTMRVLSTTGNTAQVKIEYGVNQRPDLYIRPWPGGTDWQSPDIEVRNARSLADPAHWGNTPWIGHANTIVARYRNRGTVTCKNVTVRLGIKDYTVGGAPETVVGTPTLDVPPETTTPFVEFTAEWFPLNDGHKCITASTDLYVDTSVNPNVVELSDSNNSAQSNYTRYIAASASPAKRETTQVTLTNPYDSRAEIYVIPQITGPFAELYRLYLEHSSLRLDAGESRKVTVMVESLYGDPHAADQWQRNERLVHVPTTISLTGYGVPAEAPAHPQILGGAQLSIGSGRATRFDELGGSPKDGYVRGKVVTVDNGSPAPGIVLVTLHGPHESLDSTVTCQLDGNGVFAVRGLYELVRKQGATEVSAHYPGRPGYADCDAPTRLPL